MNKSKKYLLVLFAIFMIQILSACSSSVSSNSTTTRDNNTSNNSEKAANLVSAVSEDKVLAIGHRCSGCGLCTRVDPEHFSMSGGRQAQVISQDNLESSALQSAINYCREGAISVS